MKYLVTLIVCALLTVGLIFSVELLQQISPERGLGAVHGVWFIVIMTLPLILLFVTIWAVIGFTKTVNRWIAENQVDDCPPVMHSRHSKDAAIMQKDYQRALMYGAGPKFAAEITGYDPWEGVEEHPNQDDEELQDYMNNHGQGDMTDDEHPNQEEIDFYNNSPPGSV